MRQRAATIGVVAILLAGCSPRTTPPVSATASQAPATSATTTTASVAPSMTAPATRPPVSAPPATQPASPAVARWLPVPPQDSVAGTQFQDVVWTGARFVATGVALGAEGVFLDSPDGRSWHRQEGTPLKTAFPDRIAAGPRGVVAVGTVGDAPASWWSSDGLGWTARRDAFPATATGTDTIKVTDVVSTGDGWLAVGREDPACNSNCGQAPVRSLVWTSTDGLHWAGVPTRRSLAGAGMNGVAAGGPGYVAAGAGGGRAVLWTSVDGSARSRVPDDPIFHPRAGGDAGAWTMGVDVAAGHDVVVVVGWAYGVGPGGEPEVLGWWSPDGRHWESAPVDRGPGGQVFSVAMTPGGFLATGPSGEPSCLGGIWASLDGQSWACVASDASFGGFGPYAAAGSPTTEVVVGLTSSGEGSPNGLPGAAWWRPSP